MIETRSAASSATGTGGEIRHTSQFDCTCPACTGGLEPQVDYVIADRSVADPGLGASVDKLAGTTAPNGKEIWSADRIADYLNRTGASWIGGPDPAVQKDANLQEITFGFHESQTTLENNGYVYTVGDAAYGLSEYFNFAAFNDAQRDAAREAMGFWDDVVSVSFREAAIDDADIAFGNLASAPQTQAYARLPLGTVATDPALNVQVRDIVGDVWVSASQPSNFQLNPGGYGLNTLTHEIGHAIGLSHPGNYNFGPGFAVNYQNGAEYFQDARNYTIMSYWNARDIGARDFNFDTMTLAYGATPMIHDILAVQKMYGADTTTRTGDTIYGFNSNAGKYVFDFTVNTAPTVTIWDAGGNDTLDASGYRTNQIIDLNPGSLSSIGGVTQAEALERLSFEAVNANRAALGYAPVTRATYDANMAALAANADVGRLTDNVGIAYGAIIENAVGGSGDDLIIANAAANRLDGGAGTDIVSYRDAKGGVVATLLLNAGLSGEAQGDRYTGIEGLEGSAFADTLTAGLRGATLIGGLGADTLIGGFGHDIASYRYATAGVTASLLTGRGTAGEAAGDRLLLIDALEGSAFDDTLTGGIGRDTLSGLAGDDTLDGGWGDDLIDGGVGNDALDGGWGDDRLLGGAGNDTLDGGWGNDLLDGGAGNDTLTGGLGRDTFAFGETGGTDVITDFRRGQDRIDLSAIDAVTGGGKDGFAWIGAGAFSGAAGELRSYAADGVFYLAGDTDGDGVANFTVQTQVQVLQPDLILA